MPFTDMSKGHSPSRAISLLCISLLTGVLSCSGDKSDENPVDKTRPTVISTAPIDGDSTVSVNTDVSVTFSEPMDAGVMISGVLTLNPPASGVTGYSNRVLTFTPSTALDTNKSYTATVSTAVRDTAGNTLAAPYVWHFSTYRDTIPPTVTSTTPASDDSATVNTLISINFSERMDVSTLNSGTILFDPAISGSFAIQANRQVVFTPALPLDTFEVYT
ncbi:MAG: Ig-like domain-containing protein, partial [candidate division Zixibacteria bacterium]|nr:Ig-like domain-containing protein [candidate division Zixibacteria bacterium]